MHIKHIHDTIEKLAQYACEEACKNKEAIDTQELKEVVEMVEKLAKAEYHARISKAMEEADEEEKEEIKYIIKKMKEEGEDWDEDEAKRFYRGQPRSRTSGRFMSRGDGRRSRGYEEPMYYGGMMPEIYNPMEYYRDMDRMDGKMYYSGGGQSTGGNSVGQSGQSSGMNGNMGGNTRGYSDGYNDGLRDGRSAESRYDKAKRNYTETKEMHKGNTPEDNSENMKKLEELLNTINEGVVKEYAPKMTPSEKAMTVQKLETWAKELKQS